jgi:hypothetical protein
LKYQLELIEKQIDATLKANPLNENVHIFPHAGEINVQTFINPALQEGFANLLPLISYQYQGRRRFMSDATKQVNVHELKFRFFTGAESVRMKDEAKRYAYGLIRSVYDDINGHWLRTDQPLDYSSLPILKGDTMAGVMALTPFMETDAEEERLIVNLPNIVVYATDYIVRVIA